MLCERFNNDVSVKLVNIYIYVVGSIMGIIKTISGHSLEHYGVA